MKRVCLVLVLCLSVSSALDQLAWWENAIFYQVYPRSFKDTDVDGVGDIKGITEKLDYLKEIGVTAIWLSPMYKSPMNDFGYDIANFTEIDQIFGTMADFDALVAKCQRIGMKIVMDYVPNHISDQHEWFQIALNKAHPQHLFYKDFFIWKNSSGTDPKTGKPKPPNNWLSVFNGPAWEWNEDIGQFYFHAFAPQQPDLNYRNPNVITEMTSVLDFWLDKGIDGFRMDAAMFIYENATLADEAFLPGQEGSIMYDSQLHNYDTEQPETFVLMQYWIDLVYNRTAKDGKERALFYEVYDDMDHTMMYYGKGKQRMAIPFNFVFTSISLTPGLTMISRAPDVKNLIYTWMDKMPKGAVANWVVGNHDKPRVATRVGSEMVDSVNMLTGTLPGVQCVYYGEELGMHDTFIRWDQTVDTRGKSLGPKLYQLQSRDPERTPFQWDDSPNAGFSTNSSTWLPLNPDYWYLNAKNQLNVPGSHVSVFQAMAEARKDPVLQRGDLDVLVPNNDTLIVVRSYEGSYFALVINMGSILTTYTSQNVFAPYNLDMDMTVAVASGNSGYKAGVDMKQGSLSVTLRPKAAVLLRSGASPQPSPSTTSSPPHCHSAATHLLASPFAFALVLALIVLLMSKN